MSGHARSLSTFEAYERWAEHYPPTAHNPLMRAEQLAVLEALPEVRGCRVLDLACGSGRYSRLLAERGARSIVAADFSPAMLRKVCHAWPVRADLAHLPFADDAFDVVVSGLALGHAADLGACVREAARVLKRGGSLIYSDFHTDAARAGLTRSFKDKLGRSVDVPTNDYDLSVHRAASTTAGLEVDLVRELRVGVDIVETFSGSEDFYRRWNGVSLVLIVRARRPR